MLFISFRERLYIIYVGFSLCTSLAVASAGGLGQEFLWPAAGLWSDISHFVFYSLALALLVLFLRRMVGTDQFAPKLDRMLRWLAVLQLCAPISFVISMQSTAKFAAILDLFSALVILGVGLYCALRRQRSAYFFVIAFGILAIGGILLILRQFTLLPASFLTDNSLQISSAMEALLLALALADRFNQLRRDKEQAQQASLEAQSRAVENLRESERILEDRVKERTAALIVQRDEIERLANHDALTGLPTRRLAWDRLQSACKSAMRTGHLVAVLFLDLDGFKQANDRFGHEAGDIILKIVANRLLETIRAVDTAARFGGDEFLVILTEIPALQTASDVAEKILGTLAAPILYGDAELSISSSIGIAIFPDHAADPEQLLKIADKAMYQVKKSGKNNYRTYRPEGATAPRLHRQPTGAVEE